MTHKSAKLLLDHADTAIKREKAIRSAIELGMPLSEIEEYLDLLEVLRGNGTALTENRVEAKKATGFVSMD